MKRIHNVILETRTGGGTGPNFPDKKKEKKKRQIAERQEKLEKERKNKEKYKKKVPTCKEIFRFTMVKNNQTNFKLPD